MQCFFYFDFALVVQFTTIIAIVRAVETGLRLYVPILVIGVHVVFFVYGICLVL